MSYFGRLGARAGGATPVGLAPAHRLASPFARIDQRLNLFVQWGTPLGRGTPRQGGDPAAPEAEGGLPHTTTTATIAAVGRGAPPPATHEVSATAVSLTPADFGSKGSASSPRSPEAGMLGRADAVTPGAPLRVTPSLGRGPGPVASSAPASDEPTRVGREEPRGSRIDARVPGAPESPGFPPSASRARRAEHQSEQATEPRVPPAWQQALDRVNAWISQGPRAESGSTSDRSEPRRGHVSSETAAERPMATSRDHAASSAPRVFEQRASAPRRAPEAEAQPRLTIGSIEVRVVPPTPPPVVMHAPQARVAGSAAPSPSSARLPSHLTFGLRQR